LDEVLQNEVSRSARYGAELSVLILNIDYFKNVNDKFGHLVGDIVLIEVGYMQHWGRGVQKRRRSG